MKKILLLLPIFILVLSGCLKGHGTIGHIYYINKDKTFIRTASDGRTDEIKFHITKDGNQVYDKTAHYYVNDVKVDSSAFTDNTYILSTAEPGMYSVYAKVDSETTETKYVQVIDQSDEITNAVTLSATNLGQNNAKYDIKFTWNKVCNDCKYALGYKVTGSSIIHYFSNSKDIDYRNTEIIESISSTDLAINTYYLFVYANSDHITDGITSNAVSITLN